MDDSPPKPTWLERIGALLMREPEDRDQLVELLRSAYDRNLLDSDALSMIEGVMQVAEMQARDIMIPRAQMDVIDIGEAPDKFIPLVIETNHSRFPVIEDNKDHVIGILLAKDLLRYYAGEEEFNVRQMLRPAVFIPESKRLNVLLKDFRANRNHMAIVVDEYGGVAGLVTIEDVLEQIVGDIEDEYDFDETEDDIIADKSGAWRVKAVTELAKFNTTFGTRFDDADHDTIGGLVLKQFGRMPKRGEQMAVEGLNFKVLRADSRRLHLLLVEKKPGAKSV
ncbi:MAG: CBS domain-containing protein [Betaproteobacteria bacterium]|nr:CBS domain-containing protein [Betaproteobacteria bacterium]